MFNLAIPRGENLKSIDNIFDPRVDVELNIDCLLEKIIYLFIEIGLAIYLLNLCNYRWR
jgi:hypothetical protein